MGIGPCILTKVLCGPFMGDARWVIGWAMVGRAEFAYFIAIMAKSLKMMEDKVFAIIIWGLIYATIFAPLVFRKVLARYIAKVEKSKPESEKTEELEDPASPGEDLTTRMSGHLPDFEEEETRRKQKEDAKERVSMTVSLQEKDDEISRLQDALTKMEAAYSKAVGGSDDIAKRDADLYI